MKRTFYFLMTNLAIVFVLSITLQLLGVGRYLDTNGLNLQNLLIFAAIMGFGGSFISLALSKTLAKKMSGATVITNPKTDNELWLMETVKNQAYQAGISMPEATTAPAVG